jgi:hypothetical protein
MLTRFVASPLPAKTSFLREPLSRKLRRTTSRDPWEAFSIVLLFHQN